MTGELLGPPSGWESTYPPYLDDEIGRWVPCAGHCGELANRLGDSSGFDAEPGDMCERCERAADERVIAGFGQPIKFAPGAVVDGVVPPIAAADVFASWLDGLARR
ncbi:MAG: hypothetical protein FWG25_02745 [Promicromonosporaceae bacterium]|nr:hypothetical protein [Promicromonosporaceae bacterium]